MRSTQSTAETWLTSSSLCLAKCWQAKREHGFLDIQERLDGEMEVSTSTMHEMEAETRQADHTIFEIQQKFDAKRAALENHFKNEMKKLSANEEEAIVEVTEKKDISQATANHVRNTLEELKEKLVQNDKNDEFVQVLLFEQVRTA